MAQDEMERPQDVHGRQVGIWIGVTFGLTWLLNLALWLVVGYGPNAVGLLQLQMLIPALVTSVLGMFVFRNSPLYQMRRNRERTRFFFYYLFLYTLVVIVTSLVPLFISTDPGLLTTLGYISLGAAVLGLLVLAAVRLESGREVSVRVGLGGGKAIHWLVFSLGFVLFYGVQVLLNAVLGLGQPVDLAPLLGSLPPEQAAVIPPLFILLSVGLQTIVIGPVLGLLFGFGEEYGWRWYLQGELTRMGKVKGVLLVGVIWGIWHAPVIAMGHNYPGYPIAGIFLMIAYTIGLAFVLGYAMLKTGNAVLAGYLHALNNQTYSFLAGLVYAPANPVFSFGIGLYSLPILALVVLALLRDPVWRTNEK